MATSPGPIDSEALARYVDETAPLLGLRISSDSRPLVLVHLARLWSLAPLVTDFPLPDDLEAAPVFRP